MRNLRNFVENTWTWNHKSLILAIALGVAHIIPLIDIPNTNAAQVVYERSPIVDSSIEAKLQERARELYKENEPMDLERYRLEAIRELNNSLLDMMDDSPFVDYDQMKDTYGY